MRNFLPPRSALLVVLLASVAVAKERAPESRFVLLSEGSKEEVSPVYVSGGMSTVLRFVEPVDPEKTKLLGWEGRFEPVLAGGRLVVITPLKDLEKADRFLLVVTLQNGKEFPFTVTTQDERFDHQINVLLNEPHVESLQVYSEHLKQRQNALEKENEQLQSEKSSIDHALAALLVRDAVKMTPFRQQYIALLKNPHGAEFRVTVLSSKKPDKVAVVLNLKNNSPSESWSLLEARLVTEVGGEQRPFALRATKETWAPGGDSGQIAVVFDGSSFDLKSGGERLVLELFRRGSGIREAWVFLDRTVVGL
jgi:uncharacterized protein (TIGR02268 family)